MDKETINLLNELKEELSTLNKKVDDIHKFLFTSPTKKVVEKPKKLTKEEQREEFRKRYDESVRRYILKD